MKFPTHLLLAASALFHKLASTPCRAAFSVVAGLGFVVLSAPGQARAMDGPCPKISNGVWDVNIPSARIQGRFLLNGDDFPVSLLHRAHFFLRNARTGDEVFLGLSNNVEFDHRVVPGTYDVIYKHVAGDNVPRNSEAVVQRQLEIAGDENFDINVTTVRISGAFTVNGQPVLLLLESGLIRLRDLRNRALTDLGETSDGSYAALLIPGSYDVMYSYIIGSDAVPRNHLTAVQRNVGIKKAGTLDIDVPAVSVSGDFLVNGEPAPDSPVESGRVYLEDPDTGARMLLGRTDFQAYQMTIIPGTYDFVYDRIAGSDIMPANNFGRFLSAVPLLLDSTRDVNIPVVEISGSFTANGAPAPDTGTENGAITLRNGENSLYLGETRFGEFRVLAIPGDYTITYEGLTGANVMPANDNAIIGTVQIVETSMFPIDVPSVEVTADIVFNGGAFPGPLGGELARIYLEDAVTGDLINFTSDYPSFPIAQRRVVPGSYRVRYEYESGVKLPRNQFAVLAEIAPARDGHLEINIRSTPVAGDFTLDGGAFPIGQNAVIVLETPGSGDWLSLGGTVNGSYSTVVIPGHYDASYDWVFGTEIPRNQSALIDCARIRKPLGLVLGGGEP
jgi:hypothetical protein